MARTSAVLRAALVAVAVALVCGSVASALPVIALASSAVASPVAAPREASLATFTGYWWGHTRSLRITPNGRGVEAISSGCCLRVINLHFRLSRASGTSQNATAVATVSESHRRQRGTEIACEGRSVGVPWSG